MTQPLQWLMNLKLATNQLVMKGLGSVSLKKQLNVLHSSEVVLMIYSQQVKATIIY